MQDKLHELQEKFPEKILDIRGVGLMLGIKLACNVLGQKNLYEVFTDILLAEMANICRISCMSYRKNSLKRYLIYEGLV